MNTRRLILKSGLALLALPLSALAQQEKRVRRIGFLSLSSAQPNAARLAGFRAGMAELGWVEWRDYAIDARYADGISEVAPGLATELVATKPDLLLVISDEGISLLIQRTKTIPIVFAIAQDPVGNGNVASLRRPGGNATGLTSLATDISAKKLQLLKEAFPNVTRTVLLFEPGNVGSVSQAREIKEAAPRLGMRITSIELRQPEDIEPAFRRGAALGAQAYMTAQGGVINSQRRTIIDRIGRLRIPAIFSDDQFVEAGGLMSYGASYTDNFRRAAAYVDKIFKGAKPGDLPIEQPVKFELVLNLKTARAMSIKFPDSIILQADRVIE